MSLTTKVRLKNHRAITSQLDTRVPRRAFAGGTLDLLYTSDAVDQLDDATREQVLAFAEDFLDCDCQANPHCGHPERKFLRYVLECRAGGLGPEGIVDAMAAEYGLTAHAGDVLTFLDDAVRYLDAMEDLARVDGAGTTSERVQHRRRALETPNRS